MPRLVIDDRDIEVPEGTKIIEAAERLGIMIPRFCYHPALGSVGACRVCAVKFLQGPFKGVQMSCMIDAKDGMVVSTTDAEAVEFRRYVIEWLMLHHPHDCPVCDEGGHCLLQDMTISGGHGLRRYRGKKRTYSDQDLGPLVQHEMNRCIHCYRCSRFYQEFAGYRDLGALQIANHTYFGRFEAGVLESPFAGNLSDICPTGVYTDKPSRYKGRRWDYERSPGICINCSLGCHTVVSARFREIVRQEARFSNTVNGHFICDRGRFGFYYCEDAGRPRQARVDGRWRPPLEGIRAAANKLNSMARNGGPASIACLGGRRSNLETQATLDRLCRRRNWQGPAFFTDASAADRTSAAALRLAAGPGVSLREIEQADAVIVIGADPVNEAPMLALALRQARRKGAGVAVIDPRPVKLALAFQRVSIHPDALVQAVVRIGQHSVDAAGAASFESRWRPALQDSAPFEPSVNGQLDAVADLLRQSQKPVIVCGAALPCSGLPDLAADIAELLEAAGKAAGLFYVMPGAGAFGAAAFNNGSLERIVSGIESGDVRAVLVVETDPLFEYHDRDRLEQALVMLELLVVIDCLDSDVSQKAHVLLPSATQYEVGGHFVNQEGRVQWSPPSYRGGEAVLKTGGGDHPPRVFEGHIPGGGLPSAGQILTTLAGESEADASFQVFDYLNDPATGPYRLSAPGEDEDGTRFLRVTKPPTPVETEQVTREPRPKDGLRLVLTDWTFGTEALSVRSACLEPVTPEACIWLHPTDADYLGLVDGRPVDIDTVAGRLRITLRVSEAMAAGIMVLPRHCRLDWRIFKSATPVIPWGSIKPAEELAEPARE